MENLNYTNPTVVEMKARNIYTKNRISLFKHLFLYFTKVLFHTYKILHKYMILSRVYFLI